MVNNDKNRKKKILMGIYSASWSTSMIALVVVCALEIFMLIYTLINRSLFGDFINTYRMFYIILLTAAVVYIALNIHIKKDIEHRHHWLNVVNPLYGIFFFAWALGITYFDALKYGVADPAVFMTFSLIVPLSFFLFPYIYAIIVLIADSLMIYMSLTTSGTLGSMINLSIFFIFQFVLGISFLTLKMKLAERILREKENAEIDILTGFQNRRAYEGRLDILKEETKRDNLIYIVIDLNELKEINDCHGHQAGDRLIVGAAKCLERCFGDKGNLYRIGGDEFVVLAYVGRSNVGKLLNDFERSMQEWTENNGMTLSAAYGCACCADYPESDIVEIVKIADKAMYESKARYYQTNGKDRRRYR